MLCRRLLSCLRRYSSTAKSVSSIEALIRDFEAAPLATATEAKQQPTQQRIQDVSPSSDFDGWRAQKAKLRAKGIQAWSPQKKLTRAEMERLRALHETVLPYSSFFFNKNMTCSDDGAK